MAEQDVGGIALGLTLDTTGWSSGIARAKADLEGLRRTAGNIEIGVTTRANRAAVGGPSAVAGVRPVGQGGAVGVETVVSPKFQVSAGSVRQLRTEINAQLRQLSAGGEAVSVPIKLGRVPYATMRSEIAAGIGEVPIRVKPDAGSLTAFAAVLSSMTGATPGRARATIQQAAAERGIPARAMGGPTWAGRPYLVGEKGPEIRVDRSAGMVVPMAGGGMTREARQALDRQIAERTYDTFNRLIGHQAQTNPKQLDWSLRWYQRQEAHLKRIARALHQPIGPVAATVAEFSSNNPWPNNAIDVMRFLPDAWRRNPAKPLSKPMATMRNRENAAGFFAGTRSIAGVKKTPFMQALLGDPSGIPADIWMARASRMSLPAGLGSAVDVDQALSEALMGIHGGGRKGGPGWTGGIKQNEIRAIHAAVNRIAQERGLEPRGVQAALWDIVRDRSTVLGLSKKSKLRRKGGGEVEEARLRSIFRQSNTINPIGAHMERAKQLQRMGELEPGRNAFISQGIGGSGSKALAWARQILGKDVQTESFTERGRHAPQATEEDIERALRWLPKKNNLIQGTMPLDPMDVQRGAWNARNLERLGPEFDAYTAPGQERTLKGRIRPALPEDFRAFGKNARGGYVNLSREELLKRMNPESMPRSWGIDRGGGSLGSAGFGRRRSRAFGDTYDEQMLRKLDEYNTDQLFPNASGGYSDPNWDRPEKIRWGKNARGGGVSGYCYTCRSNVQNRFTHQSTARHQANARGGGSSKWLSQQPGWAWGYRNLDEQYADPEGYEESDEWKRHRYRGGYANMRLGAFDRESRLAVGRRFEQLAERYPQTASGLSIGSARDDIYNRAREASGGRPMPPMQSAGVTFMTGNMKRPMILLNASIPKDVGLWSSGDSLARSHADIATHEFGHALDFQHGFISGGSGHFSPEYMVDSERYGAGPSPYSMASPRERFAEMFLHGAKTGSLRDLWGALSEMEGGRFRKAGGPAFKPVDAAAFHEAVVRATGVVRPSGRRVGETVHTYSPEEYAAMRTYLNRAGTAGYAIKPDGDLVSVFNVGGPGGGKSALRSAIQRGAYKLDAFDEVAPTFAIGKTDPRDTQKNLPRFYEKFGFREVGRDPWNPLYQPEGWRGRTPDVVYMERQRKRALGGMVDDDKDPLDDFDDPIYQHDKPSKLMASAFRARAIRHLKGQGFRPEDAASWIDNEISQMWPHLSDVGQPLRLRTSGAMVDVATMGGKPLPFEGPGRPADDPGHKLRAPSRRLPRGVKVRFSSEWTDFPDPSKFITSGGENTLPNWHNRWTDPGQLNMGYFEPQHRGAPMDRLLAGLEGSGPFFDPRGEADPIPTRYRSISEWLQSGRWGGDPKNPNSRARLMAYALDRKNRVLGHTMVSATRAVPDFGPQAGGSIAALHPDYVWTDPSMRGKGLASAMYSRLERFTGMPLMPSSSQTPFGKRLWGKPAEERAFGRMFRGRPLDARTELEIRQREDEDGGINQYGWRAGSTAGIEPARDFSRAVDPLTRQRVRRLKGQMRLPGFAFGGLTGALGDVGRYIVGEIGRELFVPRTNEGIIPPDVAAQLPGGGGLLDRLLSGKARMGGGRARDIGGRGSQVWDAPEDGWIIPNRLMHRVPRHEGGPVEGPHTHPDRRYRGGLRYEDEKGNPISQKAYTEARLAWQTLGRGIGANQNTLGGSGRFVPPAPKPPPELAAGRAVLRETDPFLQEYYSGQQRAPLNVAAIQEQARIRIQASAIRGLTGRGALGGAISYLTGGRARREAAVEAQVTARQLQNLLPKGVTTEDPVGYLSDQLEEARLGAQKTGDALEALNKAGATESDVYKTLTKSHQLHIRAIEEQEPKLKRATELEAQHATALSKASGGAIANFAAVTGAGVAFNVGMQLAQSAFDQTVKAAAPAIDALTGWGATQSRVTKDLAEALPQVGNLQTLLAQRGVSAGLSGRNVDFLQQQIGPGVYAKAGAVAAGQQGDLLRAALGNAPTGLFGGYGGIGGGGFLGEQLGGGKGLFEELAKTFSSTVPGQPTEGGVVGFIQGLVDQAGAGLGAFAELGKDVPFFGNPKGGSFYGVSRNASGQLVQTQTQTAEQRAVADEQVSSLNDAIDRAAAREQLTTGRAAAGAGSQAVNVGVFDARAQAIAANDQLDENIRRIAKAGVVFQDAAGNVLNTSEQLTKVGDLIGEGLTIPDQNVFARSQAQAIRAGIEQAGIRGEFERNVAIPGQFGMQAIANPFINGSTTAGLEQGFKPTIASLTRIQGLQRDITRDALTAVQAQQKSVTDELGAAKGAEFGGYIQQIQKYGQEIASLNNDVLNAQATASAAAYGFQLHMINRQIADAKGLAGQAGGSKLGELQREQYMLQRESQRLALQSQQLANEMSQRQINFQVAIAGFQAPGITGQERAARQHEAEVEAAYAQRQLNINKQQTGIAGQSFGVEGQIFNIQTARAVQDLEMQRGLLIQQHAVEQEQIAAQKQIAALATRQAQVQAKAQSLFAEATGAFDSRLGAASQYVAQFGGTIAGALIAVRRAIDILQTGAPRKGSGTQSDQKNNPKEFGAEGLLGFTGGATSLTVGEVNGEAVAVLKNPRQMNIGAPGGLPAPGGGGITVNVAITGNTISSEMDLEMITRRVQAAVEDGLGRKANLLGVGSA